MVLSFGMYSFKSNNDAWCSINYSGVDSEGCTYSVVGTFDCSSGTFDGGVSTFTGTITLGGPGDCTNVTITQSVANPNDGG